MPFGETMKKFDFKTLSLFVEQFIKDYKWVRSNFLNSTSEPSA